MTRGRDVLLQAMAIHFTCILLPWRLVIVVVRAT